MEKEHGVAKEVITEAEKALPDLFLERLSLQLSQVDYLASVQSFSNSKPLTFRTNTLRALEQEILTEVNNSGMHTKPVPWCPLCHQVLDGSIRQLQALQCSENRWNLYPSSFKYACSTRAASGIRNASSRHVRRAR